MIWVILKLVQDLQLLDIFKTAFVLLQTITFSIEIVFSRASSTTDLTAIFFAPLKFPSDVITIFALQSFILSASAEDENPAKTTEWIKPSLAQASRKMVMKRRSLIKYLKKKDISSYENLIKQLGLRK